MATYQYVLGKYGQDALVWYIGDLAQNGTLTLPGTAFGNGLSHTTFFNPQARDRQVPDGGATAALLGLGIAGLAFARRKMA